MKVNLIVKLLWMHCQIYLVKLKEIALFKLFFVCVSYFLCVFFVCIFCVRPYNGYAIGGQKTSDCYYVVIKPSDCWHVVMKTSTVGTL